VFLTQANGYASLMISDGASLTPPQPEELAALVKQHIPEAQVDVHLFSGNDHFEMAVISPAFAGKNRVVQHKMVYQALGEHMRQRVHALALSTGTPQQEEHT